MATPKHVITGTDFKQEATLINENIRELSDQMTLENLAGNTLKLNEKVTLNEDGITVADSSGISRVIIGRRTDGFGTGRDFGIKVSQNGEDAETCPDDKLVMSSGFNSLKIVRKMEVTVVPANWVKFGAAPAYTASVSFSHGLGYRPAILAYLGSTYSYPLPYITTGIDPSTGYLDVANIYRVDVDTTSVNLFLVKRSASAPSTDSPFTFYLMRETII